VPNWETSLKYLYYTLVPADTLSEAQILSYLDYNLGIGPLVKRQSTSVTLTKESLLTLCPLSSISANTTSNNQILTGCIAGITKECPSDSPTCRSYWETVYSATVYSPVSTCLPWQNGPSSSICSSTITNFCSTAVNYQCAFAKFTQSKIFNNTAYVACSVNYAPYACSR